MRHDNGSRHGDFFCHQLTIGLTNSQYSRLGTLFDYMRSSFGATVFIVILSEAKDLYNSSSAGPNDK